MACSSSIFPPSVGLSILKRLKRQGYSFLCTSMCVLYKHMQVFSMLIPRWAYSNPNYFTFQSQETENWQHLKSLQWKWAEITVLNEKAFYKRDSTSFSVCVCVCAEWKNASRETLKRGVEGRGQKAATHTELQGGCNVWRLGGVFHAHRHRRSHAGESLWMTHRASFLEISTTIIVNQNLLATVVMCVYSCRCLLTAL